jgi:hypothetical protein
MSDNKERPSFNQKIKNDGGQSVLQSLERESDKLIEMMEVMGKFGDAVGEKSKKNEPITTAEREAYLWVVEMMDQAEIMTGKMRTKKKEFGEKTYEDNVARWDETERLKDELILKIEEGIKKWGIGGK